MEQKANQQNKLIAEADKADKEQKLGDKQFFLGEAERLDRECATDIKVLARLNIMINECFDLVNKRPDKAGDAAEQALVSYEGFELRARVTLVGSFERLKDLVEAADCLPASRQTVPDQALRLLRDKILCLLRRNGADCYLAGLPEELTKRLTLRFATLLERFVPDVDQREKLLSGEMLLKSLPSVEQALLNHVQTEEQSLLGPATA